MAHPCICLDVGGTQIKAAAVSADGGLRTPLRVWDAHAGEEAEKVLDHLASIARQAGGAQAPQDVRLAFPGPFDYENGVCQMRGVAKYDRLYGVNVRLALAQRLNLTPQRLRFCNDAAAFALGEMAFGDAAGAQRAMFVCVGTGCGSAFGVNGRLAPEGFPGVPPGGLIYNAPFLSSCVDDHLSRRGLMALSLERMGEALDGKALAQRAKAGDREAIACFEAFGERLCDGLEPFVRAFEPQLVCLGGQITQSADRFCGPLASLCRRRQAALRVTRDTSLRTLQGLLRI